MAEEGINWNQERTVYKDKEGELWVKVYRGYMAIQDYIDGGQVVSEPEVGEVTALGIFTNSEIDRRWG